MRHHQSKPSKPITVAIANDAASAVEALLRVIHSHPEYRLLWVAHTGSEAVQNCLHSRPDVILMDLNMPEIDGAEATRQIMQRSPCAILIVTASVSSNTAKVFEAMGHGALDAVTTPAIGTGDPEAIETLLKKISIVARFTHSMPSHSQPSHSQRTGTSSNVATTAQASRSPQSIEKAERLPQLIVIGTSTGGPHALQQILSQLPTASVGHPFNAAIVIIQHLDAQFSAVFVDWLNQTSQIPVSVARNGARPEAGKVLVAGTNQHLVLRPNQTLRYKHEPSHCSYRPSVDVFFQSVAQHWFTPGIALILTGMGCDGTEGIATLHAAKWHTIAESDKSCAVFGMPKAAIERGVIHRILSLEEIPPYLIQAVHQLSFYCRPFKKLSS